MYLATVLSHTRKVKKLKHPYLYTSHIKQLSILKVILKKTSIWKVNLEFQTYQIQSLRAAASKYNVDNNFNNPNMKKTLNMLTLKIKISITFVMLK